MLKTKINLLSLVISVAVFSSITIQAQPSSFQADTVTYLWPTDASPYLSSTFAETRSAHLHAGIDIRTWGREGYKVFATRDGVVYRIGKGPRGYGNVIYLKHNDASFSVYAHLNRFEPELQSFADSLRLIDYTFELDEFIENENIRYKQGDLIGFTGSTGVGPPHLHFELRTPDYEPFNPLLTNLNVEDNLPPKFTHLGIEFLNSKTLHFDRYEIIPATNTDSLAYFGEISISGPVGLSVNVHDRANRTPNVYAVHSLLMVHESDTLFHSKADYFSYDHSGHMFLDRSYPILSQTRKGFQRLYVVEGNKLPFYRESYNQGVINFEEGIYPIRIIASDFYGNHKTAWVTLKVDNIKEENRPPQNISYVPAYPRHVEEQAAFAGTGHSADHLSLYASADEAFAQTDSPYPKKLREKTTAIKISLISPNQHSAFETPSRDLWIQFPKKAPYDTLNLKMEMLALDNSVEFNFYPNRLPVQGSLYFNYLLPDSLKENDKLALFSYDQYRDRLFFLNSENSHGMIRAELKEISNLKLLEDHTAPWVGQPKLRRNLGGLYVVEIPARDDMTKIDYKNSFISVNGDRGIVEYDPEKNILVYYHPDFSPKKMNEVKFSVLDGVGNKTERTSTIPFQP